MVYLRSKLSRLVWERGLASRSRDTRSLPSNSLCRKDSRVDMGIHVIPCPFYPTSALRPAPAELSSDDSLLPPFVLLHGVRIFEKHRASLESFLFCFCVGKFIETSRRLHVLYPTSSGLHMEGIQSGRATSSQGTFYCFSLLSISSINHLLRPRIVCEVEFLPPAFRAELARIVDQAVADGLRQVNESI